VIALFVTIAVLVLLAAAGLVARRELQRPLTLDDVRRWAREHGVRVVRGEHAERWSLAEHFVSLSPAPGRFVCDATIGDMVQRLATWTGRTVGSVVQGARWARVWRGSP
jgi:hypothetical protein